MSPAPPTAWSVRAPFAVAAVLLAVTIAAVTNTSAQPTNTQPAAAQPQPFANWPKDAKPELTLVVTGQTYGYLQPCGCSRPQLGGLERRANFMAALKAKGWPVAGVDLGDVLPVAGVVPEQVVMKYATTLPSLREMGYVAVGVGKAEFANGLYQVLDQYASIKEQPPFALGGNIGGRIGEKITPRDAAFPGPGPRAMVGLTEVVDVGTTPVSVTGVVGASVQKAVAAMGAKTLVAFTPEKDALTAAVKEITAHAKKPQLNVLLYQGTFDEAKAVAKAWPQFGVIVCLSDDSEPPIDATVIAGEAKKQTLIIQVGHKGRYVGVLGGFKNAAGGLDLKYELVPLGETYITAGDEEAARKANPVLPLLQDYADRVRTRKLIDKFPEFPPPGQAAVPNTALSFVGSESCQKCHAAEFAKWKETPHSHAFETLEKTAKRPNLRQFDGECVMCHTVGLGYKTGYRDDRTTAHLKGVGCESCHGPGSGHAADPKNAKLLALQSPWRQDKADRLPSVAMMEMLGKLPEAERAKVQLKASEQRMLAAVSQACAGCHDIENDPKFDLPKYWPKVFHATPPAKK